MEQTQIRQPKMLAAQSFIQILRTFLAILIKFPDTHFSYLKNNLHIYKIVKLISITCFWLKESNLTCQKKKRIKAIKLRI